MTLCQMLKRSSDSSGERQLRSICSSRKYCSALVDYNRTIFLMYKSGRNSMMVLSEDFSPLLITMAIEN